MIVAFMGVYTIYTTMSLFTPDLNQRYFYQTKKIRKAEITRLISFNARLI